MKNSIKFFTGTLGIFFLAITICQAFGLHFDNSFAEFIGLGVNGGSTLAMAAIFTSADVTWNGKEAMSIGDAVLTEAFTNPEVSSINKVVENIVAKQQIIFIGNLSKMTKKSTGCGTSPNTNTLTSTEKFWLPEEVEFWDQECTKTIDASFWVWGQKKGIDRYDLTSGDYADFVQERMASALKEDLLRMIWFNDTDAATTTDSPAGNLFAGTNTAFYTIIDGFWKQIFDAVASDATKKIAIAPNLGSATYVNQAFNDTDTTNKIATKTFQGMYDAADDRLKENPNAFFVVTGSLFDQYRKELQSYSAIPASYEAVINGISVLKFNGINIIPVRFWDRTIKADFKNGTKYYRPHRALLTTSENIQVGVDSFSSTGDVRAFYLPETKTTNFRGGYKVDAKLMQEHLFMAAYE